MSTYTTTIIPGQFLVDVPGAPEQPDVIIDSGTVELTVVSTSDFTFSYEIVETFDDGISRVSITEDTGMSFIVTANGQSIEDFDTYVGTIFWGAGNATQILTFEYEDPLTQEYTILGFVLGGTPIIDIVTTSETITGFSDITSGPFAPGQSIDIADLPGATVSEVAVITGSPQSDDIDGGDENDIIDGRGGDDVLSGGAGNDVLGGRAGADLIRGGAGNDGIEGGSGGDDIRGGAGSDTALYLTSTSGVSVNLATGAASGGHANGDRLVSIENLVGSDRADALTGDAGDNVLFGERGGDVLRGGAGDDIIEGGGGGDRVLGGAGIDTATYGTANGAVSVNLTTGVGTQGNANGDTFASIENLVGSGFDDTLIGSSGNNAIAGGAGDDELRGSAGNDMLEGNEGADFLNGGSGIDTAIYATSATGVALSLAGSGSAGDADGDTFFRVENVIGSAFDDLIRGDLGDNAINGGRGDDAIRGGSGDDTITGGRGNDTLYGGGGEDTFVFRANNGDDMVVGFNTDADVIRFVVNGLEIDDLVFDERAGNLVIDYGTGTITMEGLTLADADDNIMFDFG